MDKVLAEQTLLLNEETEEIVPSKMMSNYSPEDLEEYTELIIKTLQNEEDIYTTFEVGSHDLEGVELELSLYCKNKPSFVERYMDPFLLIHGWLEDTVIDLCIKQSEEVLLSRAQEVVQDYPEEIIKSMNGTEYFQSMELHKALMESNACYQECVEHYMIDYSVFQVEDTCSLYIEDKKSFYKDLEEKAIHVVCHEGKYQYNMWTEDLEYILFTNLDYKEVINDINFHKETVSIGNINLGLTGLEGMLNDFLHNINPKHFSLTIKEEKILRELNHILDDIQCLEEE